MKTQFLKFTPRSVAVFLTSIALFATPLPSFAIAVPSPTPAPTSAPLPAPISRTLSYASTLEFRLDQAITSAKAILGQIIPISLAKPLILAGVTIAPKGAHASLRVINAQHAAAGDVQGFIDVEFTALTLADGQILPLISDHSHLTNHVTRGHDSTVGAEDTVGSMTLPYYSIFAALRRGREINLPAGTAFTVLTGATITLDSTDHTIISLPSPPPLAASTPSDAFPIAPLYTPTPPATPKPKPTSSP